MQREKLRTLHTGKPHQSIDSRMALLCMYVFNTGPIPLSNLVAYSLLLC
jgi:hypothetical protein